MVMGRIKNETSNSSIINGSDYDVVMVLDGDETAAKDMIKSQEKIRCIFVIRSFVMITSNGKHSNDYSSSMITCDQMEVAIVAGTNIPSGICSLPFASSISLEKILNPQPVSCAIKAFISSMGNLCINEHLDWIPLIRIAKNCQQQNVVAQASHNSTAIVLQTTRDISVGEELKVWLSLELMIQLKVPFLSPKNIISYNCYRCHRCGITFTQPNPLKVHLAIICPSNEDFIKTNFTASSLLTSPSIQTPSISSSSSLLVKKVENDSEINENNHRTHSCVFCGKLYTRKYGLKIHIRTHTGQKPLRCRYCGRAFSDPSNLNKHVRLHRQDDESSPYQCKICGKILVRRRDLLRHLKSRHQSAGF